MVSNNLTPRIPRARGETLNHARIRSGSVPHPARAWRAPPTFWGSIATEPASRARVERQPTERAVMRPAPRIPRARGEHVACASMASAAIPHPARAWRARVPSG